MLMTVIKGIEEETLIQRFISGDQTAYELLFRFYYPGLVTFVTQIISDRDEAEEIVQDFFVHVWTGRKNIHKSSSLKSYYFVSVKNRAFNYLKKEQIREKTFAQLKDLVEKDLLFQPDLFVESELQQQIAKAMEKLPERTREIFMLSRFKGISNDEIAIQLELSKRTVETQISNALKILRNELKEYKFLLLLF
jgi:RNA polymerase sigma-70 factor (ECF subfamily)